MDFSLLWSETPMAPPRSAPRGFFAPDDNPSGHLSPSGRIPEDVWKPSIPSGGYLPEPAISHMSSAGSYTPPWAWHISTPVFWVAAPELHVPAV
jgi:hypothetical protein